MSHGVPRWFRALLFAAAVGAILVLGHAISEQWNGALVNV